VSKANGLVHATPTGMAAHPGLAVPEELIQPSLWFADVVYFPLETELVSVARSRGCAVAQGGGMAAFQAVDAFELSPVWLPMRNECCAISRRWSRARTTESPVCSHRFTRFS